VRQVGQLPRINWMVFFMQNLQLQVVKQNSLYNCYVSVTVKCVLHGPWI